MDQRGHGRSQGHNGYIPSLKLIQADQILFQKTVIEEYFDISNPPPIYVIAHSFGAAQVMGILMDEHDPLKQNQLAPL